MSTRPFCPHKGSNQQVTAAGTSAQITLDATDPSVRVVNTGSTNAVHVRIGKTSVTATVADTPVLPGQALVLRKGEDEDALAYISASGTTLEVQTGDGGY